MNHSPAPQHSTRPSRQLVWIQRGVFVIVATVMLGAMAYAARGTIAQLDWDPRGPASALGGQRVMDADNEYIAVQVREAADGETSNEYELRLGVAYDNRIVYWRAPATGSNSEFMPGSTIMTSRGAGEILVAVGPILETTSLAAGFRRDSRIVEIDGQPFAVVHREAVANLMNGNAGHKKSVTFRDARLGVHGAIDLKHVS